MSLLIKALHKAEQEKASEDKASTSTGGISFELAPKDEPAKESAGPSSSGPIQATHIADSRPNQKAAGVVFAAKSNSSGTSTKVLIVTGIVLLLLVAIGFYYYLESLKQPELIVPARVVEVLPTPAPTAPAVIEEPIMEPEALSSDEVAVSDVFFDERIIAEAVIEKPPVNEGFSLQATPSRPSVSSPAATFGQAPAQPKEAGVKVTRNNPPPAINPNLNNAYAAFNAGDDAAAQAAYRQVLQADIRNTDALLGMAAVAMRQGRVNDAMGWYGKVLEVEPRNSFAQAAMASLIGQVDPVSSESRIKNMLALQPNAAHLHASLGNLYASQNQWSQAQQSYFEAHRLDASNAEYAFNLAISLDQLAKPALALQYYRQTLVLLGEKSVATIDRAALESRIAQLQ